MIVYPADTKREGVEFMRRLTIEVAAWLLGHLPQCLATRLTLFTFGSITSPIAQWYCSNGIMKYAVGTKLRLVSPYTFGYGLRPTAVVVGYGRSRLDGEDCYVLDMTTDTTGDYFRLTEEGYIPENVQRETVREVHSKWNIENQFRTTASLSPTEIPALKARNILSAIQAQHEA